MIVRTARAGDAASIVAIWNAVIDHTAITFTTERKTVAGINADIAARAAGFQVVEEGGRVLGFATFFRFRAGPGYVHTVEHSIQLAPEARGRGAGRALMAALEGAARAEGMHAMIAAVTGENPAGAAFHAALGYREVGRLPRVGYKFGRRMDLVLMQKLLIGD